MVSNGIDGHERNAAEIFPTAIILTRKDRCCCGPYKAYSTIHVKLLSLQNPSQWQ